MTRKTPVARSDYSAFRRLDGSHPFKRAVPGGYVDYPARRVAGARVLYFNFPLAKEMGLIPADHPERLDPGLRRALTDTFALQIVNEYEQRHGDPVPSAERMPGRYMATRYLQLQHRDRSGRTSGDGRGVWNGVWRHRGRCWDVSSRGTGVTCLCPATAETGRFFKTGSRTSDYGCGTACLEEGLGTALMSETFHRNGIATERTLTVIELPSGFAINVRAAANLIRPSHLFLYLKQGDLERLRGVVDLFFDRQVSNGRYPDLRGKRRYRHLADEMACVFGRLAATLEREYIFCWLDWDGDNVLGDGGIIDYGSVRQFGLFHREYRFDDGPRWSTSLAEQRAKARDTVRVFAQLRDYLCTGVKPPLRSLRSDPVVGVFDRAYRDERTRRLLHHVGLDEPTGRALIEESPEAVAAFDRAHAYFERARSARGPVAVDDGLNWNAIYSTRDLLRELPLALLADYAPLATERFFEIALSTYAGRDDRRITAHRARMASRFQRLYIALLEAAACHTGRPVPELLADVARRSAAINHYARITGDAAIHATRKLLRMRRRLSSEAFHSVIRGFLDHQTRCPDRQPLRRATKLAQPDAKRVFNDLLELLTELRHGL